NTARSEQFIPSSVDPSSTISSPIEPTTPQIAQIQGTVPILKVSTKNNTSSLASLTPEERIQKLRDRRHVVACLFCRGRKIACHPEPTEESTAAPSRSASPDGYPRSAPEKRAPCGECVYPERTPRTSRRRRAREQATAANAVAIAASLQEVRENARAESQSQPRIRVQIPQQQHILPRPVAPTYAR
ncbi:3185_t:CDS:2, partial [Acaulospora colombiana]